MLVRVCGRRDIMRMSFTCALLALWCSSSTAYTPAVATDGGIFLRRTVGLSKAEAMGDQHSWRDVTHAIAEVLPPLANALVTVSSASDGCRLAILDPELLSVGPASIVVPERFESLALGTRGGKPLLPEGARLMLLRDEDSECAADALASATLEVAIEAAEPLLTTPSGLNGPAAMAQAALRSSLAAGGVSAADISKLESLADPTPACRVMESFLARSHRPEALLPAARRAAHHISHLLREEAANAAAYLRNNDAAVDSSRTEAPPHAVHFLLDNVRSAYNVGSIFRTADTARCASVITCGFTPHPPNPKLAKTAFGAIESVVTEHRESTLHAIRELQAKGVTVYAMETTERSVSYCDVDFPPADPDGPDGQPRGGVALVLGNEEIGVDTAVMEAVDGLVEIPTFGLKNSLNVASAASIVVYEVLRQWGALNRAEDPPPAKAGAP